MTLPTIAILLFFLLRFRATNCECPQMSDIPVMYNKSTFMCMNFWNTMGGDLPVNSCNGMYLTFYILQAI